MNSRKSLKRALGLSLALFSRYEVSVRETYKMGVGRRRTSTLPISVAPSGADACVDGCPVVPLRFTTG
jgi:hypothetical protein